MFVRRRPLLRTAVIGGGAYAMGKRRAQQSEMQADQEAQAAPAQPAPAQTAPPAQASGSMTDRLAQLAQLHEQGSLTDEEFAAAKAKLLNS